MQSVELQVSNLVDVATKNGKGAEAAAIIKENLGQFMERKLSELVTLTKPFMESFQESEGQNMLVESFRANFNMTGAQARVAAGLDYAPTKNGGYSWDELKKGK